MKSLYLCGASIIAMAVLMAPDGGAAGGFGGIKFGNNQSATAPVVKPLSEQMADAAKAAAEASQQKSEAAVDDLNKTGQELNTAGLRADTIQTLREKQAADAAAGLDPNFLGTALTLEDLQHVDQNALVAKGATQSDLPVLDEDESAIEPTVGYRHKTIRHFQVGEFEFIDHVCRVPLSKVEKFKDAYKGLENRDKLQIVRLKELENETSVLTADDLARRPQSVQSGRRTNRGAADTSFINSPIRQDSNRMQVASGPAGGLQKA